MKKAILMLVGFGTMLCSFAQETPSETPKQLITKEDYLQKSKAQKTGAIVLLSAGGAVLLAGFAVAMNDLEEDLVNLFNTNHTSGKNETLAAVLIIGGGAAMLGSIPLFKSANKYKRIAKSLSFKNESAPLLQRSTVFYKPVPSLSLKISL